MGGVRKFTNMIHADIAQRIHTAINQSLLAHIHEKSGVSRDNISANFLDVIDFSAKFRDFIRIFEKTISATKVLFFMYGSTVKYCHCVNCEILPLCES